MENADQNYTLISILKIHVHLQHNANLYHVFRMHMYDMKFSFFPRYIIVYEIVSIIAAIAMVLALLTGCRSDAFTETESTSAETESAAPDDDLYAELDLEEIRNQTAFTKNAEKWEIPVTGCVLAVPESFRKLKGQVFPYDVGETGAGSGVFHCRLFYVPSPDEDREALTEAFNNYEAGNDPDGSKLALVAEAAEKYQERGVMPFLDILAFSDAFSLDEAKSEAWISETTVGESIDLGQKGSYKYYCLTRDYESMTAIIKDSFTDAYYAEFMSLVESADQLAANITVTQPTPMEADFSEGAIISFETTDLDGNAVSSADLFAGHKVTMINIWATWCGVCIEEMPGLEELNSELASKDCQIIGICDDTADDTLALAEAKEILAGKGVTYTNLVQTEKIRDMLPIPAYPISYFVDSEGRILTSPEVGANLNAYRSRINKLLKDQ